MTVLLNTLYVTTPDAYLRLESDTVCVMVGDDKRLQVPLHHLGSFVLFGHTAVSPALLARCADDGRSVVWMDLSGRFQARLEGPVSGNVLLRLAQYRAAEDSAWALTQAKAVVAGKLRNSRQLLMRAARETDEDARRQVLVQAARLIAGHVRRLPEAPDVDSVRGLEGDSAHVYFGALRQVFKPSVQADFPFDGRNRRPPRDRVNALLSFLYALVLNDCRSALEAVGLDPQLGFLHAARPGRQSLALDLLEEFRAPLADRLALTLINRAQLQPKHFDERAGGAVLLGDDGRKTVIAAYQARKQETVMHPVLQQTVAIGLLPHVQARLLARHLREDVPNYVPYLQR